MSLPTPTSLAMETALSVQHVDQVVDALRSGSGGGWRGHIQAAFYWLANSGDIPHVKAADEAYQQVFFFSSRLFSLPNVVCRPHLPWYRLFFWQSSLCPKMR